MVRLNWEIGDVVIHDETVCVVRASRPRRRALYLEAVAGAWEGWALMVECTRATLVQVRRAQKLVARAAKRLTQHRLHLEIELMRRER